MKNTTKKIISSACLCSLILGGTNIFSNGSSNIAKAQTAFNKGSFTSKVKLHHCDYDYDDDFEYNYYHNDYNYDYDYDYCHNDYDSDDDYDYNETISCTFNKTTKTLTITGDGTLSSNTAISSDTTSGDLITSSSWHDYADQVETVSIQGTISTVDDNTFQDCPNIKHIILGDFITSITENAFPCNTYVESLTIGKGISSSLFATSGHLLLNKCKKLIVSPENEDFKMDGSNLVSKGGTKLFAHTPGTDSTLHISKDITTIQMNQLFFDCDITAFDVDSDNPNFIVNDGCLYSKDLGTIYRCLPSKKGALTLSDKTNFIGHSDFTSDFVYPEKCNAFSDCNMVTSLYIGTNLTSLNTDTDYLSEADALQQLPALTSISVSVDNTVFSATSKMLLDKATAKPLFIFCKNGTITIPKEVTELPTGCIHNNPVVKKLVIPDHVTTLNYSVIDNCPNLKTIQLGAKIKSFSTKNASNLPSLKTFSVSKKNKNLSTNKGVLYNKKATKLMFCPGGISSYTFPATVAACKSDAFSSETNSMKLKKFITNDKITSLPKVLPSSITILHIGKNINNIDSIYTLTLKKITISNQNKTFKLNNGIIYGKKNHKLYKCQKNVKGKVTVQNGTTTIAANAFHNCKQITSFQLPSTLKKVGYGAFSRCIKIKSITFPSNTSEFDFCIVDGCSALTKIIFKSSKIDLSQLDYLGYLNHPFKMYFSEKVYDKSEWCGYPYMNRYPNGTLCQLSDL